MSDEIHDIIKLIDEEKDRSDSAAPNDTFRFNPHSRASVNYRKLWMTVRGLVHELAKNGEPTALLAVLAEDGLGDDRGRLWAKCDACGTVVGVSRKNGALFKHRAKDANGTCSGAPLVGGMKDVVFEKPDEPSEDGGRPRMSADDTAIVDRLCRKHGNAEVMRRMAALFGGRLPWLALPPKIRDLEENFDKLA